MKYLKWVLGAGAAASAAEYSLARYFFRRTMLRSKAKKDRTKKMAGTDWDQYIPEIMEKAKWLEGVPKEEVTITSWDGLKLYGLYIPTKGAKRTVLCFHGYTSDGLDCFTSLAKYYLANGYNMMIVDERAHGKSEGTYIGFGCLDRWDALDWIHYLQKREKDGTDIILHGISMGGATVLMTAGLDIPDCVKAVISDCAFTSAWDVFVHVLKSTYHMPAFPIMHLSDAMTKKYAGYGLAECNSAEEVKNAKVPILFIHGSDDTFVPCAMCHEIYENCSSPKDILIVPGAGHAECYYKSPKEYEAKIDEFLKREWEV